MNHTHASILHSHPLPSLVTRLELDLHAGPRRLGATAAPGISEILANLALPKKHDGRHCHQGHVFSMMRGGFRESWAFRTRGGWCGAASTTQAGWKASAAWESGVSGEDTAVLLKKLSSTSVCLGVRRACGTTISDSALQAFGWILAATSCRLHRSRVPTGITAAILSTDNGSSERV